MLFRLDPSGCGRSVSQGTSLATVIENLPLSYNMDTKSLERTPSLGPEPTGSKPFKRGHIRRSSYESAEIQLNFARRMTTSKGTPAIAPVRCLDEATCSVSLQDKPDCSKSVCSETVDSGLGDCSADSDSKRSSLDRRSELSDWEDCCEKQTQEPSKGVKFFNFPRSLFSRHKMDRPWKMFGGNKVKETCGIVHTTGLILEERPGHLPAKSEDEAARHRQLHQEMIEQAKKREQRAEKERKQARAEQKRLEEQAAAACRVWMEQILPRWSEMRESKRCRELWWQGIPGKVRGRVWSLVIGNSLKITPELYDLQRARAADKLSQPCVPEKSQCGSREYTVSQIYLDVSRTFPNLGIFQKDGPYYEHLLTLLSTYACYRPDIGYVQSMPFLAAVLLLQMDPYPAFVAFANLLSRPLQSAFFSLQQPMMTEYFIAYDRYLEQELPELHRHFDKLDVRPDLYLIEWIYTMFGKSLPFDVTCRIWDVYLRDGEEFMFKTALGILRMHEDQLLQMDFDDSVAYLTRLPPNFSGSDLFRNIEPFMRHDTSKHRKRFMQILQEVDEKVNPGGVAAQSQISSNVREMKMSKSLSGFVGDLLNAPNS